jgi:hypothetical protein
MALALLKKNDSTSCQQIVTDVKKFTFVKEYKSNITGTGLNGSQFSLQGHETSGVDLYWVSIITISAHKGRLGNGQARLTKPWREEDPGNEEGRIKKKKKRKKSNTKQEKGKGIKQRKSKRKKAKSKHEKLKKKKARNEVGRGEW